MTIRVMHDTAGIDGATPTPHLAFEATRWPEPGGTLWHAAEVHNPHGPQFQDGEHIRCGFCGKYLDVTQLARDWNAKTIHLLDVDTARTLFHAERDALHDAVQKVPVN